jgi:GNAT superfamily N-acetyltransferase
MDDRIAASICLRDAWPAPEVVALHGWQLRAGKDGYNRANSVWTGAFSGELPAAIATAEAFYRSRRLRPRFQVFDFTVPAELDAELDRRGYACAHPCSDMAKPVADGTMPAGISISPTPTPEWLHAYAPEQSAERRAEIPLILPKLPAPSGFILCRRGGEPAGVALAGKVGDGVAVDCVLTLPKFRRAGVARSILLAAEAWAAARGARRMLLSVVDGNAAAVPLYVGLGYRKLSGYHYRFAAD